MTLDQIASLDFSTCLRPQATQYLLEDLLVKGRSINLVCTDGQGKKRMLDDIQKLAEPYCRVWQVDVKPFRTNYSELVKNLARQAELDVTPDDFNGIFERSMNGTHILLILDNLEYLSDYPPSGSKKSLDPKFDKQFIGYLNALKYDRYQRINLLCSSSKLFKNISMHGQYSSLELTPEKLPPLGLELIIEELERQFSEEWNHFFSQSQGKFQAVCRVVHKHHSPYQLLSFLREKIERGIKADMQFESRLTSLVKQFDHIHGQNLERKIFNSKGWISRHFHATGLRVGNLGLTSLFKQIFLKNKDE